MFKKISILQIKHRQTHNNMDLLFQECVKAWQSSQRLWLNTASVIRITQNHVFRNVVEVHVIALGLIIVKHHLIEIVLN